MFSGTVNPYDDLVNKATDENLASEDWDVNLQICDKVQEEGSDGARNAVAALVKRLAHRNPNVQLYALELANTLAQNCSTPLHQELSSRTWTAALTRLVNDRSTSAPVQKKALKYIHDWAKQFEESGEPNLGLMGELYDQLRAKNMQFEDPEPAPEQNEETRRRAEEEELARVIELSKRDKGGWGSSGRPTGGSSSSGGAGSSSQAPAPVPKTNAPSYSQHAPQPYTPGPSHQQQPPVPYSAQPAQAPPPEPVPVDINTATRVRALYTFSSPEFGELSFERGDIIKVLDRGFKEWWRGAVHGKIGIFPVVYVEALPEPTAQELQEEAQNESRVFASLGLVEQLLAALKEIDPARGDRIEDRGDIQEMYQASVALQPEITALLKKYSDQKAELEHMNANFIRAMRQYDELRQGGAPAPGAPGAPAPGPGGPPFYQQPSAHGPAPSYGAPQQAQSQQGDHYAQQPPADPYHQQQPQPQYPQSQQPQPQPQPYQNYPPGAHQQAPHTGAGPAEPGQFYHQQNTASQSSLGRQPSGAPSFPPGSPPRHNTNPGSAGVGAGADPAAEHAAAWDAYYRARGEQPPPHPPQATVPGAPMVESPNLMGQAAQQQGPYPQFGGGGYGVDGVAAGLNRMTVGQ